MDEIKTKQQVVEKIKESAKILVTVSDNPSVDALSAALALTLLLDKQEKYATAIFSGETPPAIAFLEPEKTFDDTTDSLRDFIIALNKEKADHLRYKVEGDAVKIFITPYKTTIDQSDLEFSQGDYNVELVIALGVDNQDSLDKALEEHGQILHDAAIITMTAGDQTSDLGGIDWHDGNSSSLSEMVAGLAEALKVDKKKSLLDEAIATALLTGVVAQTDRFSNEHTTSKAMTVAATLMAAGADQQLIATELQAAEEIPEKPAEEESDSSDESDNDSDVEVDKDSDDGSMTIKKDHDPSSLEINHDNETLADLDRRVLGEKKAKEKVTEEVAAIQEEAAEEERKEDALAEAEQVPEEEPEPEAPALEEPTQESAPASDKTPQEPTLGTAYTAEDDDIEPVLGGTLNATAEQAAEDARREAESDQNRTILSHSYLGGGDETATAGATNVAAMPAGETPEGFPGTPSVVPGSVGVNEVDAEDVHSAYAVEDVASTPSAGISGERVIQPLADSIPAPESIPSTSPYALAPEPAAAPESAAQAPFVPPSPFVAPEPALEPTPAPANPVPADLGLPLPPPLPDFSQINGAPAPAIPLPPTQQPTILGDILAPEPAAAPAAAYEAMPAPDLVPAPAPFETTNAVADPNTAYAPEEPAPAIPPLGQDLPQPPQPQQQTPTDPGQFQIPSQQ